MRHDAHMIGASNIGGHVRAQGDSSLNLPGFRGGAGAWEHGTVTCATRWAVRTERTSPRPWGRRSCRRGR